MHGGTGWTALSFRPIPKRFCDLAEDEGSCHGEPCHIRNTYSARVMPWTCSSPPVPTCAASKAIVFYECRSAAAEAYLFLPRPCSRQREPYVTQYSAQRAPHRVELTS